MIKLKGILTEGTPSDSQAFWAIEANLPYIAGQFAETDAKYVGKGFWGRAYKTASGRILKVTSDPQEVAIAARFKKLAARPHVVGIYDVRPINRVVVPHTFKDGSTIPDREMFPAGYYIIHMDPVTPLSEYNPNLARLWDDENLHTPFMSMESDESLRQRYDHIAKHHDVFEDFDWLMSQRQKILQDARALKLKRNEAHGGNVGFNRHGNFVIYDMQSERYSDQPNPNNLGRPVDLTPDDTKYDWTGIYTYL